MEVISKDELLAELKVSARTLENWVRRGEFPRGVRIGFALHLHLLCDELV